MYLCGDTAHVLNTQNKPSQADQGIGRKEGSGEKSRKGDGKYSTISVKNNICNISKEIKDFTKKSNTSTMSDASLGHILEDVQDVQNIARMQEESKNLLHERLNDKPIAWARETQ